MIKRGYLARVGVISSAVAIVCAVAAPHAGANDHLIKLREVFAGTTGQASAQFVEAQMWGAVPQTNVAGNHFLFYDATGALVGSATFAGNLANGASQSSMLWASVPSFLVPACVRSRAMRAPTGRSSARAPKIRAVAATPAKSQYQKEK